MVKHALESRLIELELADSSREVLLELGAKEDTPHHVHEPVPAARDAERLANRAAVAVGCDQVVGAHGLLATVASPEQGRHAELVLFERDQRRVHTNVGAELERPVAQYRLQAVLGDGGAGAR